MSASPADSPQSLYQKSSGRDIIPIILDASHSPISTSDLAERVNHDAGLLANPGISAALLSMSGYAKSYTTEGYEINNPSNNMYLAYAQQGMHPPHMHAQSSYSRSPVPTAAYASSYGQRSGSQDSQASWETTTAPQIPEIISWSPKFGAQGSKVQITLRSTFAIDANSMNLEIKFGNAKSSTLHLTALTPDGPYFQYKLLVDVPAHSSTTWTSYDVPITLDALDHSGNVMTSMKLDEPFSYTTATTALQASPVISRKRRFSNGSEPAQDFPAKRMATMPVGMEQNYGARSYAYDQQNNGYAQSSPHMAMAPHYNRATSHPVDLPYASPSQLHANPTSQPHRQSSPHAQSWTSSTHGALSRSPSVSGGAIRRGNTMTPSTVTNPRLVRTTQISSQSPSPASTPSAAPSTSNFNPYAMYPHKAQLKINGELDSMTQNWTPDERHVRRRLVQFWRTQTGSTITATFTPVAPEDRKPNAICISCIWWEAKDQYYVTSVDTIFLLESLVAVRFTVEEKNRIRRNLEGFRPMTVSKGKSDSEDFFKLIMGFPNPKPRNIEKDVKVYSWKILTLALKKIIGKYSASYSSVAPSSMTPSMGSYHTPQDITNELAPASPHSTADSALSISYHSPMTATSVPVDIHHQQNAAVNYTTSSVLPTVIAPTYSLYAYPQPQTHTHQSASLLPYTPQQHASPQSTHQTSSWDSALSMQATAPMNGHGMYSLASSHVGMGHQYQMTHNSPGP